MKLPASLVLASAIVAQQAQAQQTLAPGIVFADGKVVSYVEKRAATSTDAASAATPSPVCGQSYNSYEIVCNQIYQGSAISASKLRMARRDWTFDHGKLEARSEASFEACIDSCDSTSSCIAVSFYSGSCSLLSSITGATNQVGALGAIKDLHATSVFSSLATAASTLSSSSSLLAPNQTTTNLPYASELASHLAQHLSDATPVVTGADTAVYITTGTDTSTAAAAAAATSTAEASSSSFPTPIISTRDDEADVAEQVDQSDAAAADLMKRATTTSNGVICNPSATAIIRAKKAHPRAFCNNWQAGRSPWTKPHTTTPFARLTVKQVVNACNCILADESPVKNTGKRGLAYNDASYTDFFSLAGQKSRVSWAYNWYLAESSSSYNDVIEYIPMLYNNDSTLTSLWPAAAQQAIDNGATALFSMNEPDLCVTGSACMDVASVVKTYKKYVQPFAGKAKLGAPAITNGADPMGLTYLKKFINQCDGCTIDFINLHWYSNKYAGATYFEEYIASAREVADGRPIWITEFGLDSTYSYTDAELQSFLQTVMPWMDHQSDIHRYAYFMAAKGILVNSAGTGMSGTGKVFNSFVNSTAQATL